MKVLKLLSAVFIIFYLQTALYSLPTVKAAGGEDKVIDWEKIAKEENSADGPGFFYHDCYQGVEVKSVSSNLKPRGKKNYSAQNLTDDNPMTAWMCSNNGGIGESFEIISPVVNLIYNGYQASPKIWKENSRVKKFKVYKNNRPLCYLILKDEMGGQRFELPNSEISDHHTKNVYKFEILEVYRGSKWKDVGISHIDFAGCCFSEEAVLSSPSGNIKIKDAHKISELITINPDTLEITNAPVKKIVSQKHITLLQISTDSNAIQITPWHKLYAKNYGFISPAELLNKFNFETYDDLQGMVEVLIFDSQTQSALFETVRNIKIVRGDFNTYSIRPSEKNKPYVVNGFVTK